MYNKTILPNGIKVISEHIDHVRSISIGIWVKCGSRYENKSTNGAAHFIEHMLFKGTRNRSALEIASAIDSVGGMMNAFTGKELTSFYIKIPDYHLPMAVDLLADIFTNSCFDEEDIRKEQSVVLQEINMTEDSPDDYIHDYFESLFWDGHPLGFSVLGTRQLVASLDRETLLSFFDVRYGGNNLVVAAAGNIKHDEFVDLVRKKFRAIPARTINPMINKPEASSRRVAVLEKDLEQAHMIMGTLAPSAVSPERYSGFLLNAILGGSMSSRLFQEIREKRGIAYAIHSFVTPYMDAGLLGIYAGTSEEKVPVVISLILEELKRLRHELLTEKEMTQVKELIKGNYLLSMESTDSRMIRLAKNEISFGRYIVQDDVIASIDAVKAEDIRNLASDIFKLDSMSLAVIGRISENDVSFDSSEG